LKVIGEFTNMASDLRQNDVINSITTALVIPNGSTAISNLLKGDLDNISIAWKLNIAADGTMRGCGIPGPGQALGYVSENTLRQNFTIIFVRKDKSHHDPVVTPHIESPSEQGSEL
jgi:hypothetical protein